MILLEVSFILDFKMMTRFRWITNSISRIGIITLEFKNTYVIGTCESTIHFFLTSPEDTTK